MIACVLLMVIHRLRTGRFKTMHVITAVVVLLLGSATLLLHDRRFIQWKPTVLLGLAAVAFIGSMFIGKQPLARRLLEAVFEDTLEVSRADVAAHQSLWAPGLRSWRRVNIYMAWNFAESVWVNFKVIRHYRWHCSFS